MVNALTSSEVTRAVSGLKDLRSQKIERNAEEMLKHLNDSELRPRYSAGV